MRLAGEVVCTPTRPGLQRRGLASSARARCASPTPTGIPRPESQSVPGKSLPELPGGCAHPPAGRPFQNHRHTHFHASAKSDADRQSGQQMTALSAERRESGEGVRGGQRGSGNPGEKNKQSCFASPFVFTQLVSRNQLKYRKTPPGLFLFVCVT